MPEPDWVIVKIPTKQHHKYEAQRRQIDDGSYKTIKSFRTRREAQAWIQAYLERRARSRW